MSATTPRTDAIAAKDFTPDGVWIAHAKKLERELAALTAERDWLQTWQDQAETNYAIGEPLAKKLRDTEFERDQLRAELAAERARLDRRFSRDEKSSISHALDHLLENKVADEGHSGGWYCGNRKQFEERHRKSLVFMRALLLPTSSPPSATSFSMNSPPSVRG